ncbi:MAG: acyl-CoA thioesterase [Paenibacillaceae bacterium]|nr:acyl-CoA thioesterase [Paenibacillaceae bacterium]
MNGSAWHRHELRVRYQETDRMGVVYHANYLNWFEWGRTELIRDLGVAYRELEETGLLLPVLEAELKFRQPARYDDLIVVETRIVECGTATIRFENAIRRAGEGGELLVSGGTKHVWLNAAWKPVRLSREAPALYELLQRHCGQDGG